MGKRRNGHLNGRTNRKRCRESSLSASSNSSKKLTKKTKLSDTIEETTRLPSSDCGLENFEQMAISPKSEIRKTSSSSEFEKQVLPDEKFLDGLVNVDLRYRKWIEEQIKYIQDINLKI